LRLSDLINAGSVIPELAGQDSNSVIRELVQSLADNGAIEPAHVETITKAVIARESHGSTGFGKGIAVPHVKHSCVTRTVATIGISRAGVDFAALDGDPVYIILILLGPADAPKEHLEAMANIFRHFQCADVRCFMRQADTRDEIVELIAEADGI